MTTAAHERSLRLGGWRTLAVSVAALSFAGVVLLRLWLAYEGPLPGDRWGVTHLGRAGLEQPWSDLGVFFSVIGLWPLAICTVPTVLWFVWRASGPRAVAFVAVACVGVGVNAVLKVVSGPTPLMVERFGAGDALNYPSGHTVYAVVFFGALAVLAWQAGRRDLVLLLVALIGAMGPFRVIADAHFVSDVIAGYLFGIGWLICAAVVAQPWQRARSGSFRPPDRP